MYYLLINGQKSGPFTAAEVQQYLRQGAIGNDTQFWQEGMMSWQSIQSAGYLFAPSAGTAYQQPYQNPPMNNFQVQPLVVQPVIMTTAAKSRIAFILLGFFLGGLGIHNFYAGYSAKGLTQLLLNLFLFWTIVVPLGIGIWVIVEIITVDVDSNGYKMI